MADSSVEHTSNGTGGPSDGSSGSVGAGGPARAEDRAVAPPVQPLATISLTENPIRVEQLRARYELSAVVHHLGPHAFAGHYVTHVRQDRARRVEKAKPSTKTSSKTGEGTSSARLTGSGASSHSPDGVEDSGGLGLGLGLVHRSRVSWTLP